MNPAMKKSLDDALSPVVATIKTPPIKQYYSRHEVAELCSPLFKMIGAAYFCHVNEDEDESPFPEDRRELMWSTMTDMRWEVKDLLDTLDTEVFSSRQTAGPDAFLNLMSRDDFMADCAARIEAGLPDTITRDEAQSLAIGMDPVGMAMLFNRLAQIADRYAGSIGAGDDAPKSRIDFINDRRARIEAGLPDRIDRADVLALTRGLNGDAMTVVMDNLQALGDGTAGAVKPIKPDPIKPTSFAPTTKPPNRK